jgi:hypothetical protein
MRVVPKIVTDALREFKAKYRRTDFPDLEPSGLYALYPDEAKGVSSDWDEEWPSSKDAGVYLIFDSGLLLLYIGKASMNDCIGVRLSEHLPCDKITKKCNVDGWSHEKPMYVATVAVPTDIKFEAAALEEYLIGKLSPSYNVQGRIKITLVAG